MIKLVVFDWNGTLFADMNASTVGVNAKLKFFGHLPITLKQYREVFDVPTKKMYERLGVDTALQEEKAAEAQKIYHDVYEKEAVHVRTRVGAREVLQFIKKKRIPIILFSNHTMAGINYQLDRLKVSLYFDAVLANEDIYGAHSKGKKDRLVDYLQTIDIQPEEVLIIGDSPEEIHIGKELGLKTLAITGGFCSTARLKAAKPDVLIHSLRDIVKIIEET